MNDTLKKVQAFSSAAKDALANRDEAIVRARAEGSTLHAIANAASMTPQGVAKVLNRKILAARG